MHTMLHLSSTDILIHVVTIPGLTQPVVFQLLHHLLLVLACWNGGNYFFVAHVVNYEKIIERRGHKNQKESRL